METPGAASERAINERTPMRQSVHTGVVSAVVRWEGGNAGSERWTFLSLVFKKEEKQTNKKLNHLNFSGGMI